MDVGDVDCSVIRVVTRRCSSQYVSVRGTMSCLRRLLDMQLRQLRRGDQPCVWSFAPKLAVGLFGRRPLVLVLTIKCIKTVRKRAVLVQLIVEDVVTCFGTQHTVKLRLHRNGYNWIQVVSSTCIHLYPPSRTCIYLYPFVSDTKCICIHLYPRVEHCSTLDTCIHLYPLVSTCIARCKRKLDTSGYMSPIHSSYRSVLWQVEHSQQLIVIIRGHPAKITISTGVATSE